MSALQTSGIGRTRRAPLSVRLNDQEYALLRERAGNMALSSYMKQAALGADAPVTRRRHPPSRDQQILATILAALGQSRLASNLNQLAKAVHSGSLPVNAQTEADITQACRDVWIIRKALLIALGVESDHPSASEGIGGTGEPPRVAEAFNTLAGGRS